MNCLNDNNPEEKYERIGEVVSLFQRGETWNANYQHNGKQYRRSLKTRSKKEAIRRANRLEVDLQMGRYEEQLRAPSIEEAIKAYEDYLQTEGRAKKTLSKIRFVCRQIVDLAQRRKAKSILDINLAFVDAFRSERVAAQRQPKTILNETVIIRQLVNFARRRKMIATDPLQGLKIKKVRPKRQPFWTWEQVDQILKAAEEPQRSILTLLAETGMRIGEAKWLTWEDVDFNHNLLLIRAKDAWRPKNGEDRCVPMSPKLRRTLEQLPRNFRWVFTAARSKKYPRGDHQISERRLLQYLKRVLKRLGLSGHLHTFRHSFVSHALTSGTPESVVREWVGHLDKDVLKLYTHIASEMSQNAMKRLHGQTNTNEIPEQKLGSKISTISAHSSEVKSCDHHNQRNVNSLRALIKK